jgi:hypothetical protein
MILQAKKAGKNKIVVIGDCNSHDTEMDSNMAEMMNQAKMEYAWIALNDQLEVAHKAVPEFEPTLNNFSEVGTLSQTISALAAVGKRVMEIEAEICRESPKLKGFPYIFKVKALTSYEHKKSAFGQLFIPQSEQTLTCEAGMICLLDPQKLIGKLLTKSLEIPFIITRPEKIYFERFQAGMPGFSRIHITTSNSPVLYLDLEPGDWEIVPHPELKPDDLRMQYIPMHKRIQLKEVKK